MFLKYASNILQDISDECVLKSFACQNNEDAKLYSNIARRIDLLLTRIEVEEALKSPLKSNVERSTYS
jgi:hypothetical protein